MVDFDEDVTGFPQGELGDQDLTDETQDFRFLTELSLTAEQLALPRRGEKDFESHGTDSQHDALSKSRAAMHAALSYPRVHAPKYHITATYHPDLGRTTLENPKGQHFRTMGKADATGQLHLLPEEALYLVERGNLDLRRPAEHHDDSAEGMPFSLQSAYAVLIGKLGLTLARYTVYAGLKRSGYIVRRAPGWDLEDMLDGEAANGEAPIPTGNNVFSWLYGRLCASKATYPQVGPLLAPGLYRSYRDIYNSLAIIPCHDPTSGTKACAASQHRDDKRMSGDGASALLRCSYYVWKPRPDFKKSLPGPPNFRIAVVNAREDDVPILEQLDRLLQSVPYDPPPHIPEHQRYQKLKHGWRNVILAIVDQGVISYLRVSDAGFGKVKAFERALRGRGGKGGGGGQGRASRGRGARGR